MTIAKSEVLIWFLLRNCYSMGAMNLWCEESTGANFG